MAVEADLADPTDFYSDGVSKMNTESLFDDLYKMKNASPHEKSKNFYLCAHPFLLVSFSISLLSFHGKEIYLTLSIYAVKHTVAKLQA